MAEPDKTLAALQESEARFRSLIEAAPEAVFVQSAGRFVYLNPAACRLFGAARQEDLLGREFMERMAPEYHDAIRDRIRRQRGTGEAVPPMEQEYLRLDGARVPVETTAVALRYQGKDSHLVFIRDITARKRAEEAARESEARYQNLFAQAPEGIAIMSADGKSLTVNESFARMHGYAGPQEMAGVRLKDLDTPETARHAPDRLARMLAGESLNFEVEHRRKDGSAFPLQVSCRVVQIKGKPHFLGFHRDISELKRIQTALADMQRLESLGTLAGGIAHDFNNILTLLLGYLSLAHSEMKPGGEGWKFLKEAKDACATAQGLSQQLLTFSKGSRPFIKAMDLRPLLKQTARFAARSSNARCVFALGEAPLPANVDKEQISRVLHNLVINAVQAMPDGGDVTVRAAAVVLGADQIPPLPAGRYIRVTIEDQGPGIPPENLGRIFEPYFSTKDTGHGLGLAVCHSVMTKHGGVIRAEAGPKGGAVFILHFPAADAADISPEGAPPALTAGGGRTLVMEDNPDIARMLKLMLERLGYSADLAKDGESALKAYRKARAEGKPYRAVIMDLTIPGGVGGRETIRSLKELDPHVKAVVSSGYANDPLVAEYAAHGFSGVLAKPYRIEEVSETLRRVIGSETD